MFWCSLSLSFELRAFSKTLKSCGGLKEYEGYLQSTLSLSSFGCFLLNLLSLFISSLTSCSVSRIYAEIYAIFSSIWVPTFLTLLLLLFSFVWSWSIISFWSIPWLISIFLSRIASKIELDFFLVFCTLLTFRPLIPFWVKANQFL